MSHPDLPAPAPRALRGIVLGLALPALASVLRPGAMGLRVLQERVAVIPLRVAP